MRALVVFLAGGLGALTRYGVAQVVASPISTLVVNVVGGFVMGVVLGGPGDGWSPVLRLAATVGFLGGFTTFSTFTADAFGLAETSLARAFAYVAASVLLALLAFAAGERVGAQVSASGGVALEVGAERG